MVHSRNRRLGPERRKRRGRNETTKGYEGHEARQCQHTSPVIQTTRHLLESYIFGNWTRLGREIYNDKVRSCQGYRGRCGEIIYDCVSQYPCMRCNGDMPPRRRSRFSITFQMHQMQLQILFCRCTPNREVRSHIKVLAQKRLSLLPLPWVA